MCRFPLCFLAQLQKLLLLNAEPNAGLLGDSPDWPEPNDVGIWNDGAENDKAAKDGAEMLDMKAGTDEEA